MPIEWRLGSRALYSTAVGCGSGRGLHVLSEIFCLLFCLLLASRSFQVNIETHVSVTALRQAIAKSIVAYFQKFVDEAAKKELKDILLTYDRTLLVADPRRCEPKK